ncbi:hypothetical protein M3Y94_00683600 [Aphelenchoides besseyi]|nr:hypothetical protein M3Y94_00683600 [Aphelenchoides besseyi]KAI6231454.1 hypothetical protein M3Y95_00383500 [Aphelenchoides besseyi]
MKIVGIWMLIAIGVHGTGVVVRNRCSYAIQVTVTDQQGGPNPFCFLQPNQACGTNYDTKLGLNFRNGYSAQSTEAEITINGGDGNDYYDISVIDGFNTPMKIEKTNGATIVCKDPNCPGAYHHPGEDWNTHGAPTGGQFTITFCP